MRTVELALVLLYMLACVGNAVWANARVRGSQDDYWVANRRVGTFANSWAMMSGLASGGSVLGLLGLAYVLGIPYVLAMFAGAAALGGLAVAAVLAAVMSTTDALLLAASSALTHDLFRRLRPQAGARELYRVSLVLMGVDTSLWGLSLFAYSMGALMLSVPLVSLYLFRNEH